MDALRGRKKEAMFKLCMACSSRPHCQLISKGTLMMMIQASNQQFTHTQSNEPQIQWVNHEGPPWHQINATAMRHKAPLLQILNSNEAMSPLEGRRRGGGQGYDWPSTKIQWGPGD